MRQPELWGGVTDLAGAANGPGRGTLGRATRPDTSNLRREEPKRCLPLPALPTPPPPQRPVGATPETTSSPTSPHSRRPPIANAPTHVPPACRPPSCATGAAQPDPSLDPVMPHTRDAASHCSGFRGSGAVGGPRLCWVHRLQPRFGVPIIHSSFQVGDGRLARNLGPLVRVRTSSTQETRAPYRSGRGRGRVPGAPLRCARHSLERVDGLDKGACCADKTPQRRRSTVRRSRHLAGALEEPGQPV